MKKILLFITIVVATSCRKERSCTCTTLNDAPGATLTTEQITVSHQTKKQALSGKCSSYSDKINNGNTIIVTCKLN